ncbi:hypothetical protein EON65_19950 [archaeon]|nr:MAG: hypothetical protein EON65_19950 [archaeon]
MSTIASKSNWETRPAASDSICFAQMSEKNEFDWNEQFEETLLIAAQMPKELKQDMRDVNNYTHHWQSVQATVHNLLCSFESDMEGFNSIKHELAEKDKLARNLLQNVTESGLNEKIQQHMINQVTLQLLKVARAMKSLENFTSVDEIPSIMLSMKDSMPPAILPNMKIHSLIHSTVKKTKGIVLKKFLDSFEQHLDDETYGSSMESQSWASFLKQARSWLLAYTLVSLLPSILMESKQAVLETFQNSIDEAFTPLWGRYFYHLKQGRETKSVQQMFWTFGFAKSYVTMLLNLCSFITSTEQLSQLCDVDYATAGREQVVEKSVRFMRAHVAEIVVSHDLSGDDVLARLVEDCLDLDSWLAGQGCKISVCSVLYDACAIFHRILWMEQKHVFTQIKLHCADMEMAFADSFKAEAEDDRVPSGLFCYKALYECLVLFRQCRRRYSYFPYAGQQILSEVILEPMLCLCIGLLLYRMRTDYVLFSISTGNKLKVGSEQLCRHEVDTFNKAVTYFQSALGAAEEDLPPMASSSSRCRRRWDIVQNWMPKIFITSTQWQLGFGLKDLLKTALKTSDRFKSAAFDYRIKEVVTLSEGETLHDCTLFIRGLAITLLDVVTKEISLHA